MPGRVVYSYAATKKFIQEMTMIIWPDNVGNPRLDPMLLAEELENSGMLKYAKEGARHALSDLIGMTEYWPKEQVDAVDEHLSRRGCLTLTQVRIAQSAQVRQIVKRKAIANDHELYLVNGVLADAAGHLDAGLARLLQTLVDQYYGAGPG